MRIPFVSLPSLALLLSAAVPASGAETVLVDWDQTWDYLHPMGLDPALADPDFNSTWFLKAADYTGGYNGPAIGGAQAAGDSLDTSTSDQGSGPGPLGYEAIGYFATGGEVGSFGTTLTQPASGSRYAAYFRTTFTTSQLHTSPRLRMVLDDGALVYLDGVLVARVNKTDNTEAYTALGTDTTATLNETGASIGNEECIQSLNLATAGGGTQADSVVIAAVPTLAPGQHTLAVSARNNAATSSDLCMALQLLADDTGISATAANIQRQANGPGFADDTFSFAVTVEAINLPGAASWTSSNPPAAGPVTGSYGATTYTFTYPAQVDAGTPTTAIIVFTDATNPALTSTLTVTAPASPGAQLVLSPATPAFGTGFEEAGLGLGNLARQDFHTELGFTSNGVVVQDKTANGTGSQMLRFTSVNALMTTEAVKLDPAVTGIKASVKLRSYTSTGTGFEYDDAIRLTLETSADGITWNDRGSVLPELRGNDPANPLNPAQIDQILVKTGPGTAGTPAPKSRRGWTAAGVEGGDTGGVTDNLTLPPFTVPDAQPVTLEFTHRYNFEYDGTRWDGGAVQVAVNGGTPVSVPGSSFTQNGYEGIILTGNHGLKDTEGFNGASAGYAEAAMITSIATLPGIAAGDAVTVSFAGGWDEFTTAGAPNWEISDIKIKSGGTTVYTQDFAAGDGGLVPNSTSGVPVWLFDDGTASAGPDYYTFSRASIPVVAGDQFVRLKFYQPAGVALSADSEYVLIDDLKIERGLDPLADADGDGASNAAEDIAGTDPGNAASRLAITQQVSPSATVPGTVSASFTVPGADFRNYHLQSSNDLLLWQDVEVRAGDSTLPPLTFSTESTVPAKFWRIAIGY